MDKISSRELHLSKQELLQCASLSAQDERQIGQCRGLHNRLGFAYQIAFMRLMNRAPSQQSFEVIPELLDYIGTQLNTDVDHIQQYAQRQQTVSEHQTRIQEYLKLKRLDENATVDLEAYLFEQACRLERTEALLHHARRFLREQQILEPGPSTLHRIIGQQRRQAREHIYQKLSQSLPTSTRQELEHLLQVDEDSSSKLQLLKEPAGHPSVKAILRLMERLSCIQQTGVLPLDISWLHNNYQRSLARYARNCDAYRLRELNAGHRYAALACFLRETYQDTVDHIVDMYDKLMNRVQNRAQRDVDEYLRHRRALLQDSLFMLQTIVQVLLDQKVNDEEVRPILFSQVSRDQLASHLNQVEEVTSGKQHYPFSGVLRRFPYLRQFAPQLLEHLEFDWEEDHNPSLKEAIELLRELNREGRRVLTTDPPMDFVPKQLRLFVCQGDIIDRKAWECVFLTTMRDEIKSGNLAVRHSRRFARFDSFFIPSSQWKSHRKGFFERAGLPVHPEEACDYLSTRLNQAYDYFLESQPENAFATVDESGWHLSADPTEKLDLTAEAKLETLKNWFSEHMRSVKLPELLIEVDNELQITEPFILPKHASLGRERDPVDEIRAILAAIMAHGCNLGPQTMAQLTQGISYKQIKRITDWQMTEEAQRSVLGRVVRAISALETSQAWGEGRTSSSDGQRFPLSRRVLQQTFSHRLHEFALEFYSFVADNYAPFYSIPVECTIRDAAYVLDGLLYNEANLPLEEHYTDTHGYTEINFAAFAMLGKRFAPRIRGLHQQRIYRIDVERDYSVLYPLVQRSDRTIRLPWIAEQWDRMGHFYASLECGHTTASVALRRLAASSKRNRFYRANRELGRVLKTEFILQYMAQPELRRRIRQGLLKGEQLHALARTVFYGKQGRMHASDLHRQMNTCSSLTLILACIVYWQAKEMDRVIRECSPEEEGIDLSLLKHISPIEWENVLLYGEYVIDPALISTERISSHA